MNILFYNPYKPQVVYIESIAEKFVKEGERILLLSYDEWGPTHDNFQKLGAAVHIAPKLRVRLPLFSHLFRLGYLVWFCKKENISIVYSHYQEANLISIFAQYLCPSKFILTRHHSDCAFVDNNFKEKIGDRLINRLAKYYIAPSDLVYDQIVKHEKTNPIKVIRIDYGYNFKHFNNPDPVFVRKIKEAYLCDLLLVKAARLIPEKRHMILLDVIHKLRRENLDIKLLILGIGPLEADIEAKINELSLKDSAFILGFKNDVHNYFAASDLVIHLSESEASNSAIKEAALVETPVAVCRDVGDFSDYIENKKNSFLLDKNEPGDELLKLLQDTINDKESLPVMGRKLKQKVVNKFDIDNVFPFYKRLNNSLLDGKD